LKRFRRSIGNFVVNGIHWQVGGGGIIGAVAKPDTALQRIPQCGFLGKRISRKKAQKDRARNSTRS
jgi:hypothetical protein